MATETETTPRTQKTMSEEKNDDELAAQKKSLMLWVRIGVAAIVLVLLATAPLDGCSFMGETPAAIQVATPVKGSRLVTLQPGVKYTYRLYGGPTGIWWEGTPAIVIQGVDQDLNPTTFPYTMSGEDPNFSFRKIWGVSVVTWLQVWLPPEQTKPATINIKNGGGYRPHQ